MPEATGEYLAFIDSDDWVDADYLEVLHRAIAVSSADVAVCGIVQEFSDGRSKEMVPPCDDAFTLETRNADKFVELNRQNLFYGPVVKLYKSGVILEGGLAFPVGISYGEDLLFNYQYLRHVKRVACVAQSSYHYRILGAGTLSSKQRPDQFQTDYEQWKVLKAFYEERHLWNEGAKKLLYQRLWGIVYDGLFSTPTSNKEILSIPEIDDLQAHKGVFSCSWWIKWCILHRITFAFR